jgi:hypothetical protein
MEIHQGAENQEKLLINLYIKFSKILLFFAQPLKIQNSKSLI